MKKIFKIFVILLLVILIINVNYYIYAAEIIDTNTFKPTDSMGTETLFKSKAKTITGIIRNIGIVISVLILMIIGIKILVSSVEEKAIYKQVLPGYILGAFMVAAMSALPSIIYNAVSTW